MAEFQDRVLKCVDCSADFVFSAGEQQFYRDKNFTNEPRRCKNCKTQRQTGGERGTAHGGNRGGSHGGASHGPPGRVETNAICSQCGRDTTVPFRPTQGRPVFCRECFQSRKATGAAG
jgi:CxxC-x17-CxxC domain-containing protein